MDEIILKEVLAKESEKSYSPTFKHEISGWVDDTTPSKLINKSKFQSKKLQLISPGKSYTKRIQTSKIRKQSLFSFFTITKHNIRYIKDSNKYMKTLTMPIKPIKTPKKPKTKNEFNNILLNKFLKIDKTAFANKNFSPKKSKVVNIFKRSFSSCESSKNLASSLIIYGSSSKLK